MIFPPRDPDFAQRVRESFERQAAMTTVGATLTRINPGEVVIELPFRRELTRQHGFLSNLWTESTRRVFKSIRPPFV
jgi:acyl-coenzyme A thioesterase PaaI-like protein